MQRRTVLAGLSGVPALALAAPAGGPKPARAAGVGSGGPLPAPASGPILVAVLLSPGATVIDFAGPWEVFQDVHVPARGASMDEQMPFRLFTVAESKQPITASGGLQIVPDHTFADAPQPAVIVVGAQQGRSPALLSWLRKASAAAQQTLSVCTGAFVLARAGLLTGMPATTHHDFFDRFAESHPDVKLERGVRFVEGARISSAAGLSSGIDLALRVVERYFGRQTARATAAYLEYQGTSWVL